MPGTSFFSTGAIAPVIGSPSLKATRNGLSQRASTSHAARLAGAAGSSGRVGTSVGIALGAALKDSSGKGASYAARSASVSPRTQPAETSLPMSRTSAVSTARRNCHQISGMSKSPVGRPVLAATTRANRSGCSATSRSPISPPQSCPTSVTSWRSSTSSTSDRTHSTWAANEWSSARFGLSERPKPTRSTATERSPALVSASMTWR